MKTLLRLFIVGLLSILLFFVLGSSPALAKTTTASTTAQLQARPVVTYLKRGMWGNYYFAPTYLSCRVYTVCFTIVNTTGRWVSIIHPSGNFVCSLNPGATCRDVFGYPGTYYYTDVQQNIRVPLTVSVYGGWQRWNWRY